MGDLSRMWKENVQLQNHQRKDQENHTPKTMKRKKQNYTIYKCKCGHIEAIKVQKSSLTIPMVIGCPECGGAANMVGLAAESELPKNVKPRYEWIEPDEELKRWLKQKDPAIYNHVAVGGAYLARLGGAPLTREKPVATPNEEKITNHVLLVKMMENELRKRYMEFGAGHKFDLSKTYSPCKEYRHDACKGCPIQIQTGQHNCHGTPMESLEQTVRMREKEEVCDNAVLEHARKMLGYLRELKTTLQQQLYHEIKTKHESKTNQ